MLAQIPVCYILRFHHCDATLIGPVFPVARKALALLRRSFCWVLAIQDERLTPKACCLLQQQNPAVPAHHGTIGIET